AQAKNVPALVGIIIGALGVITGVILAIVFFGLVGSGVAAAEACMNGAESVQIFGETVSCSTVLSEAY
ncbi:hypothetical protein, partial [Leucobacter sp. G161]|uniref:hypothetical protein n=1 Tax=Leucobacter sp. G161 TaxID=663704 RepID=UPI00073E841F